VKRVQLSRRAFLRGAGGVAIALPFLEAMGCSRSSSSSSPSGTGAPGVTQKAVIGLNGFQKRFIVFFTANGTIPTRWTPTGGETDFVLSDILGPLERHRNDLLILNGVDNEVSNHGPGDGHMKGMGCLLTGTELLSGDDFTGGNGELAGWGGGISVDQEIANAIAGDTKFKSLEFGVRTGGASVWSRMAYSGPDLPLPPTDSPYTMFDRAFGDLGADPFGLEKLRAQRHTVLDTVMEDYTRLNARLGAADRQRLEEHLETIRGVESRLDNGGALGGECRLPTMGTPVDSGQSQNFPVIGDLQLDLMTMALACDLTRVASIQWSSSVSGQVFGWLDPAIPETHHDLSHEGDTNTYALENLVRINTWYMTKLAELVDRLKAVPEGTGTMFDNTVILVCNELGKGNSHTRNNEPFLLVGSAGRYFRTGRSLTYDGTTAHNKLLVSLCNAFGIERTTFGNPVYGSGPLDRLT
jgi:hypothetical protein